LRRAGVDHQGQRRFLHDRRAGGERHFERNLVNPISHHHTGIVAAIPGQIDRAGSKGSIQRQAALRDVIFIDDVERHQRPGFEAKSNIGGLATIVAVG